MQSQSDINVDDDLKLSQTNIVLKTNVKKCKVCKTGDVIPTDKSSKEQGTFFIYTRNGTLKATHESYR